MGIMKKELFQFKKELFISDLDGTLLNPHSEISPYSREALIDLIEKGLLFTVASARSYFSIRNLFEGIPLNHPVIANNGAVIMSSEGKVLYRADIEGELLEKLFLKIDSFELSPLLSCENQGSSLYFSRQADEHILSYMALKKESGDPRLKPLEDIFAVKQGIITVTLLNRYAIMEKVYHELTLLFSDSLNIFFMPLPDIDGLFTLSITHKEADKGRALRRLRNLWGDSIHITAFGDHLNDLGFFHEADYAIAVNNAEHQLKNRADQIILSNQEDGVAKYLVERRAVYEED